MSRFNGYGTEHKHFTWITVGIINDTIRGFLNFNTLKIWGWEIVCDECPIHHKMYWQGKLCLWLIKYSKSGSKIFPLKKHWNQIVLHMILNYSNRIYRVVLWYCKRFQYRGYLYDVQQFDHVPTRGLTCHKHIRTWVWIFKLHIKINVVLHAFNPITENGRGRGCQFSRNLLTSQPSWLCELWVQ